MFLALPNRPNREILKNKTEIHLSAIIGAVSRGILGRILPSGTVTQAIEKKIN
jgi:hypothetical protein